MREWRQNSSQRLDSFETSTSGELGIGEAAKLNFLNSLIASANSIAYNTSSSGMHPYMDEFRKGHLDGEGNEYCLKS